MHTKAVFIALLSFVPAACATQRVTVKPSEPHGIVLVKQSNIPQNIFPVILTRIDGRNLPNTLADAGQLPIAGLRGNLPTSRGAFWLAPGKHELRVMPVFSEHANALRGVSRRRHQPGNLFVEVKEGKRYLIGAKLEGPTFNDWKPVVFAVTDIKDYEKPGKL